MGFLKSDKTKRNIYYNLRLRTIVLAIIPLLIVFGFLLFKEWDEVKKNHFTYLEKTVRLQEMHIKNWFQKQEAKIQSLAQLSSLRSYSRENILSDVEAFLHNNKDFTNIGFINTDGFAEVAINGNTGYQFSDRTYFLEGMEGKSYISKILNSKLNDEPVIIFSSPVYSMENEIIGIVTGEVKLTTINNYMQQGIFGKTGETYLTDKDGLVLIESRFYPDKSKPNDFRINKEVYQEAVKDNKGSKIYQGYRGNKVFGSFIYLPEREWIIFAQIDRKEVFTQYVINIADLLSMILLVLLITIPLIIWLNKWLAAEIKKREKTEERYRNLFNINDDVLFVFQLNDDNKPGLIIEVNDIACKHLGISRETFLQLTPSDISLFQSINIIEQHLIEEIISKGKVKFEFNFSQDNEVTPIEVHANIFNNEGQRCILVSGRDISEHNNLKDALKKQLDFEKIIAKISTRLINGSIDLLDQDLSTFLEEIGEFVGVDRSYIFMLSSDFSQAKLTHVWSKDGLDEKYDLLKEIKTSDYQWWMKQLAGLENIIVPQVNNIPPEAQKEREIFKYLDYQSALVVPLVYNNKLMGFIGFATKYHEKQWFDDEVNLLKIVSELFVNAIERRKSMQALKESEERNSALVDAIPDLIFVIDKDGKHLDVKKGAGYDLLLPREQLVGSYLWDIFPPQFATDFFEKINKVLNTDKIETIQSEISVNGMIQLIESRIVKAGTDKVIVIVRDISDQKKAEQKLLRAREAMSRAQKITSLAVMASGIAHEINQPLNAIKMTASSILFFHKKNIVRDNFEMMADVEQILRNSDRIDKIVKNIKSLFKEQQFSNELVNINSVIDEMCRLVENEFNYHGIRISKDLEKNLPPIKGAAIQIEQVILNLFNNAKQVLVNMERENKLINIATKSSNSAVLVEVSDNGIGIAEDNMYKIFEPFFSTSSDGMGMGLAIVTSIVSNLNGRIRVFNNSQGGATFQIEFPGVP